MHHKITRQLKVTDLVYLAKSSKRKLLKKEFISRSDKTARKIGFTWERFGEQFEKGFQETLLYKESTGNPNVPQGYKTVEDYHLGNWQT